MGHLRDDFFGLVVYSSQLYNMGRVVMVPIHDQGATPLVEEVGKYFIGDIVGVVQRFGKWLHYARETHSSKVWRRSM